MTADLDSRIRGLVVEVVESAPPAPELDFLAEPIAMRARRPIAVVMIGVTVVIALVATAIAFVGRSDTTTPASGNANTVTLSLDSIPRGMSTRRLEGLPVFLDRNGRVVTVFVSDPQRIVGETRMWWCPHEHVFVAPRHGEQFDKTGRVTGGPPPRGLDRLATRVRDGTIAIRLDAVIHDTRPRGRANARASYSFCNNPIVAGAGRDQVALLLDRIPSGVSTGQLGTTNVFFVRDRGHVTVFVGNAQHLAGETVEWCPNEQYFYSPEHGELFRPDGALLQGPATRGLDRLETRVRAGVVTIDKRHVLPSPELPPTPRPPVPDPACANPVKSGA
jgi:Rieske Fe-S protein